MNKILRLSKRRVPRLRIRSRSDNSIIFEPSSSTRPRRLRSLSGRLSEPPILDPLDAPKVLLDGGFDAL